MRIGYIRVYRQLWDNPRSSDPEWISIWVYLLSHAVWTPTDTIFNGKRITLEPGQLTIGRKILASACGVNESKARRVLDLLEIDHQIDQQMSNHCRLITIKNWKEYQSDDQRIDQPVTNHRPTSDQPVTTYKEYKEYKEDKNIISSGKEIEEVKKKEKLFEMDSLEMGLVNLLCEEMRKNNPKVKLPNLQKWASEVDKMMRIDSRSEEEIRFLVLWSQQDSFWKANILSMGKLREKFDQLMIKAKSDWEAKQKNKILSF